MAKTYKVRDNTTGQVLEVPEEQLGTYGLQPNTPTPVVSTPLPPITTPVAKQPIQKPQSLAEKVGGGVVNLGKALVKPAVDYAKLVGAGLIQAPVLAATQGKVNIPIMSPEELTQAGSGDAKKASINAAKKIAGAESYLVPFGKGANILSKAIVPGAIAGGLQGVSDDNATVNSVIGDATLGAAGGAVLHGASKILGAAKGVEKVGNTLRNDVSKIQVNPSIYGAQREKDITKTLDSLGISGNAQQKYEKLQPAMQKLGDDIQTELNTNPKIVSIDNVKTDFLTNLKKEGVLRRGELDNKSAVKQINGYIESLYADTTGKDVVPNSISTSDLFTLKQNVNRDYQVVANKLKTNGTLSDRDRVISVARQTLDDIISQNHPNVKAKTVMQSHLFDAAPSLEQARNNPQNLKAFGLEVPTGGIKDKAGAALQGAGKATQNITNIGTNPVVTNTTGQVASKLPSIMVNGIDSVPSTPGVEPTGTPAVNPAVKSNSPSITPTPTIEYVTGHSPEESMKAYMKAVQAGDKAAADQLYKNYQIEMDYQDKKNKPQGMSSASTQMLGKATAATAALDRISGVLGQDPNKLLQMAIPGSLGARQLEADYSSIADAIGGLRTGASVSPQQQKYYTNLLPKVGDTPEEIASKLAAVKAELAFYLQNGGGIQDNLMTQNTLPPITAQ